MGLIGLIGRIMTNYEMESEFFAPPSVDIGIADVTQLLFEGFVDESDIGKPVGYGSGGADSST